MRGVLILVCWPAFKYTGYPMTWQSATVMTWAGLRGAVGMCMALFILLDPRIPDPAYKTQCIFYMAVMVRARAVCGLRGGEWRGL